MQDDPGDTDALRSFKKVGMQEIRNLMLILMMKQLAIKQLTNVSIMK